MKKQFDFIGLGIETIVFPVHYVWANIKNPKNLFAVSLGFIVFNNNIASTPY